MMRFLHPTKCGRVAHVRQATTTKTYLLTGIKSKHSYLLTLRQPGLNGPTAIISGFCPRKRCLVMDDIYDCSAECKKHKVILSLGRKREHGHAGMAASGMYSAAQSCARQAIWMPAQAKVIWLARSVLPHRKQWCSRVQWLTFASMGVHPLEHAIAQR